MIDGPITVGPARGNYVRLSKTSSWEESQRRWPRLRKVLAKFNAEHESWRDADASYNAADGEHFIDIAMDPDKRQILVADLEAAGFDVIDDDRQTTSPRVHHPYREGLVISVRNLRKIIREELVRYHAKT